MADRKDTHVYFHPKVYALLEQMVSQGIYGRSVADVTQRVVCERLQSEFGIKALRDQRRSGKEKD